MSKRRRILLASASGGKYQLIKDGVLQNDIKWNIGGGNASSYQQTENDEYRFYLYLASNNRGYAATAAQIDLTEYTKLHIDLRRESFGTRNGYFGLSTIAGPVAANNLLSSPRQELTAGNSYTLDWDIADITGSYYLAALIASSSSSAGGSIYIKNLWLS